MKTIEQDYYDEISTIFDANLDELGFDFPLLEYTAICCYVRYFIKGVNPELLSYTIYDKAMEEKP